MCDYSLHAISSRPAKVGETLISTPFRGAATFGFASPQEEGVAVCLLPGTELAFEKNVRYRGGWFKYHTVNFNVAKFCKITPEMPYQHHDALAFPDGSTVLVTSLKKGQRVRVLQLPVTGNAFRRRAQKNSHRCTKSKGPEVPAAKVRPLSPLLFRQYSKVHGRNGCGVLWDRPAADQVRVGSPIDQETRGWPALKLGPLSGAKCS